MRETIFFVALTLSVIAAVHSVIAALASHWYGRMAALALVDMDEHARRNASRPWYIGYTLWFARVILRRKL